jgi:hypothetical protein
MRGRVENYPVRGYTRGEKDEQSDYADRNLSGIGKITITNQEN